MKKTKNALVLIKRDIKAQGLFDALLEFYQAFQLSYKKPNLWTLRRCADAEDAVKKCLGKR